MVLDGIGLNQQCECTIQFLKNQFPHDVVTTPCSDSGERYKLQCDVASSYSILSMGVACFQWQPPSSSDALQTLCKVEAFNIWMLSQHSYTIDPSSAQFLIDHGFDFNKQFRYGLPYTPVHISSEKHNVKVL